MGLPQVVSGLLLIPKMRSIEQIAACVSLGIKREGAWTTLHAGGEEVVGLKCGACQQPLLEGNHVAAATGCSDGVLRPKVE